MNDDAIYKDFQSGTMQALYESMYPSLMSYAMKLLGYDYSFLAEDCTQDAIYKTYLNKGLISNTKQLKAYLYTAVRNKAISILRKGSSRRTFLKTVDTSEQDITIGLIEQETQRMLFAAIDNLPESYRAIVEMSFEEGLKNAEIAKRIGITESAVKKRKYKMLENLRQQLDDPEKLKNITIFLISSRFFE